MIKAYGDEKDRETTEKEARASLMEEFKRIISSQIVEQNDKRLRAVCAKVASTTSANDEDAAGRCASALMEKFSNMNSKAPSKSG